jgi:asparagine synthase (glutamine-hydrolysing)
LARDRVGVKPIYFTRHDGEFHFASEIKGLLADPRCPRRVCNIALYHYLTYLTTPAPLTMFDGIYKLPCSTYLEIEADGAMNSARYWNAAPGHGVDADRVARMSEGERTDYYIAGIRERLERAVEKRMMSDVPYGAFLSGGIDSSANVALMDRFTDEPVNTFTVGFSDHTHLNELDHAHRIATLFKTNHHEVLVNEADMIGYIADLVHQQDEPLADWVCIPLHFVSELARKSGIKVVQVGEGSDEQFCGYRSYMGQLALHRAMGAFPRFVQRGMALSAGAIAGANVRLGLYADIADRMAKGREPFWSGSIAFWEAQKKSLLGDFQVSEPAGAADMIAAGLLDPAILRADSFEVARSFLAPFDREYPAQDQLTRMIHNEFKLRLPELLLMRVDKISMASSLEAREPFLDQDLVEFTMDIPQSAKVKGREAKHLLKRAVTGIIPDDIIHRRTLGFAAPRSEWLKAGFGARVEREIMASPMLAAMGFDRAMVAGLIADHRSGRRDTALPVWVIYNLVAWHAHWIEGVDLGARAA